MSFTVSLSSAVLLCEIVEPATLNDRSLTALEASIESIALLTIDKRVSQRAFICHQSRTFPLVSLGTVAIFIYRYFHPPAHHLQGGDTSLQMFTRFRATVSR